MSDDAKSLAEALGALQGVERSALNAIKTSAEAAQAHLDELDETGTTPLAEAAEALENINLTAAELVNLAPDQQLLAIAGGLDAVGSNAAKIQVLESLASDASLLIPLLENDAENEADKEKIKHERSQLRDRIFAKAPPSLNLQDFPWFRYHPSLVKDLKKAVPDLAVLLIANIVLFAMCFAAFGKYDVR